MPAVLARGTAVRSSVLHGLSCLFCNGPLTQSHPVGTVTDSRIYGHPYQFAVRACPRCCAANGQLKSTISSPG